MLRALWCAVDDDSLVSSRISIVAYALGGSVNFKWTARYWPSPLGAEQSGSG